MHPQPKAIVSASARAAMQEIRRVIGSGSDVSIDALESLHREYPEWFAPFELLLTKRLDDGDVSSVQALVAHAEQAWPGGPGACLARAMVHYDRAEFELALEAAYEGLRQPVRDIPLAQSLLVLVKTIGGRRAVRDAPLPPDLGMHLGPPALALLVRVLEHCGDARRAEVLLSGVCPEPGAGARGVDAGGGDIDWEADIVWVPSPGSDTAVVVFTGLAHETGVPMEVLYSELAPFGFHFVGLRDMNRLAFLGALPSLGADPAASAGVLRQRLADMGATKVVMIGNSAGCVGAMLYGALAKADAVVCYGPISSMVAPFESRGRAVTRRVRDLVEPKWLASPVGYLAECDPPIPVQVNFGELMELDRLHAAEIAALPAARLETIAGHDRHDAVRELIARGELQARLAAFLEPIVGPRVLAGTAA